MTKEPEEQSNKAESGVGSLLRASRERVGEDLREIADALRIRYLYLRAIEAGAYDELPGSTYAVGFIRSYADYLGLDGAEVVRRYKKELEGVEREAELDFPTPISEGKVPSGALILVGVTLAVLAYGIWYAVSSSEQEVPRLTSKVPPHLSEKIDSNTDAPVVAVDSAKVAADAKTALESKNAEEALIATKAEEVAAAETAKKVEADKAAAAKIAEELKVAEAAKKVEAVKKVEAAKKAEIEALAAKSKKTPPEPVQPKKPEPKTPQPNKAEKATVAVAEPVKVPEPEAPSGPRVYGSENTGARIILTSVGDSWVEIKDGETIVLTRLLHDGDTYFVPNRPGLVMNTGNAGSVGIEVDGAKVPPVGDDGEVVFNVPLDPVRLREGKTRDN